MYGTCGCNAAPIPEEGRLMDRDFMLDTYGDLVAAGLDAGYEFLPVVEYLTRDTLPDRFVILRHDVDRKPVNARKMARREAELGVESTYYFRTIDKTLRPELIETIADLGHEIGYHYEDLDRANGELVEAHRSFADHLETLRTVADVRTVCMHGNPLTPYDNRDLFRDTETDLEDLLAEYDLVGEAYLSMDFTDVTYFSDTGRTWRDGPLKVKDETVGPDSKSVGVDTTAELAALLATASVDRVCLLAHPNRWADSYPEFVVERTKDSAINIVKRGIHLLSLP
jgi:hypothetical protein